MHVILYLTGGFEMNLDTIFVSLNSRWQDETKSTEGIICHTEILTDKFVQVFGGIAGLGKDNEKHHYLGMDAFVDR